MTDPAALSPATHDAGEVIRLLGLEPLPAEGGHFRRVAQGGPLAGADGRRSEATIWFLLAAGEISALHRLDVDETWRWVAGDAVELWQLSPDGLSGWRTLARGGAVAGVTVPAGVWQGARLAAGGRWALVACVTTPEFRWDGFELGGRAALTAAFPGAAAEIAALTR